MGHVMRLEKYSKWWWEIVFAILITLGIASILVSGGFGEALDILNDPDPLATLRDISLYRAGADPLAMSDFELYARASNGLDDGVWFMTAILMLFTLVMSALSWLPLRNEDLRHNWVNRQPQKVAGWRLVVATLFVVLALVGFILILVLGWQDLAAVSQVGADPNMVWKGTDEQVGGQGPVLGFISVIVMGVIPLLPALYVLYSTFLSSRTA
jgi:hypothetical protein